MSEGVALSCAAGWLTLPDAVAIGACLEAAIVFCVWALAS